MAPPTMPVAPPTAQPAPAATQPAPATVQTTAHTLAAAMPATAAPAAAAPLAGGNRLEGVMHALKTAKVGNRRNDLPIGVGIFLLKSAKFLVTEGGKWRITAFSLFCVHGIQDGNQIAYGSQGYSGPIPGETYEDSVFQDMSPSASARTFASNIRILRACLGWSDEKVKQYQATDQGAEMLLSLLSQMSCVDLGTLQPTNQPCVFSNQVVVQISSKVSRVQQKDKATGLPTMTANGPVIKEYTNTFWDKKIPIPDLINMIGDEAVVKAFGTEEAAMEAIKREQEILNAG